MHRLIYAILKTSDRGLFLLDGRNIVLPPVSHALEVMFRRQDFSNLTFEKLLSPCVSAKTLTVVRNAIAGLLGGGASEGPEMQSLPDIEVRLTNPDGSSDTAHYGFHFDAIDIPNEPRAWLVRVDDVTMQVQTRRELEELRNHVLVQGEALTGVLRMGGARFEKFLCKADASMKTIDAVLKKSTREDDAFRNKLEEALGEVDRLKRAAASLNLGALQTAAQLFEDALQELRARPVLSGADLLPLAVKLDHLHGQFALLRSLVPLGATARTAAPTPPRAALGNLDGTLQALSEHVAQEQRKQVVLDIRGLAAAPPKYHAAIKNVAIQLIRNAVVHGIEAPAVRAAAGKPAHGTLRLEFKSNGSCFELTFEDDGCGLNPEEVRVIAIRRGLLTEAAAAAMRDRDAIKLIFKSGFTTLATDTCDRTHGAGMSLVRRYVHDAGGKIALASRAGRETRFKISLPAVGESRHDEFGSG